MSAPKFERRVRMDRSLPAAGGKEFPQWLDADAGYGQVDQETRVRRSREFVLRLSSLVAGPPCRCRAPPLEAARAIELYRGLFL